MESKKCSKCKKIKSSSKFSKQVNKKDGLQSRCKDCSKRAKMEYQKTKNGLISRIYSNQKFHSRTRNHQPPQYTKKTFKNWLLDNELFNELFNKWVNSGYNKAVIPSVDRKNDKLSYTLDNIQLMTWQENNNKGRIDLKNGKIIVNHKAVIQYDIHGNFINEFLSIGLAGRATNLHRSNISSACKGIYKHSGGFIWRFKYPLFIININYYIYS